MKKKIKKMVLVAAVVSGLVSAIPLDVSAAVCTEWSTYKIEDNCDYTSGICYLTDWSNSNFRTEYKRKSCTDITGRQWFETTQSTYKHGCCR